MFEHRHPYGTLLTVALILGMVFWFVGGSRVKDIAPYYVRLILGKTATVTIKGAPVHAEVVQTKDAMEKGLSGRDYLEVDHGMLFAFPQSGFYSFTMAKTKIPLDIIWINENVIVYIEANAQPGTALINPSVEADQVLEIRGGQAGIFSWSVGDTVTVANVRSPIHF